MLTACAAEGIRLLNAHFQKHPSEPFTPTPFLPVVDGLAGRFGDLPQTHNPDLFYSGLSVLHATEDERLIHDLLDGADTTERLERSLGFIEDALYRESRFEQDLVRSVHKYTAISDEQIRAEFNARFDVQSLDMMDLPTDRSVYLAKINHGYWEYMRAAYDDLQVGRARPEELNVKAIPMKRRRLRVSCVSQFVGRQIQRHFSQAPTSADSRHVSFCVSLVAGTEPPQRSLKRELSSVTRGAAMGMLSMFDAAMPGAGRFQVGDGGAPRYLIMDKKLDAFYDKYIADSEACLFVVPPHLKQIDFVDYKGSVYKFLVPPTKINETWKTVAATLLGYLARLGERHKTITILTQGASIAPLMGLLFSDVDAMPDVRVRFFDMGRVLDVAAPELLKKQGWAQQNADKYIAEGRKVFRMSPVQGFSLASPV